MRKWSLILILILSIAFGLVGYVVDQRLRPSPAPVLPAKPDVIERAFREREKASRHVWAQDLPELQRVGISEEKLSDIRWQNSKEALEAMPSIAYFTKAYIDIYPGQGVVTLIGVDGQVVRFWITSPDAVAVHPNGEPHAHTPPGNIEDMCYAK